MRLARLDLVRFGRFADQPLLMPRAAADFHIVYGPNEAGKSTIRDAIADLLYGIEERTPYKFKYPGKELRLNARIEREEDFLEIVRLKNRRDSLLDADGTPIAPSVMHAYLGATDRRFFVRMFALDHAMMVKGGQEILKSSGDLGPILFQAASGLSSFHAARDALQEQADRLWSSRARKDVSYYDAKKRFDEAASQVRQHQVGAHRWQKLKSAYEHSERRLHDARAALKEAETTLSRLQRVRRVAPRFQTLSTIGDALVEFQGCVRMPPQAATDHARMSSAMMEAKATLRAQAESVRRLAAQRDAIQVETQVLGSATQIDALYPSVGAIEDTLTDLPKRLLERGQLWEAVRASSLDQGFGESEPHQVVSRLPTEPQRIALRGLAAEHALLAARLDKAVGQQAAAKARQARQASAISALAPSVPLDNILERIQAAEELAASANIAQLDDFIASQEGLLADALRALHPWSGSAQDLATVRIPDASEFNPILEARHALAGELPHVDRERTTLEEEIRKAERDEAATRRGHAVPGGEELREARSTRDVLFDRALTGAVALGDIAGDYAQTVREADSVADRRYQDAGTATRIDVLTEQRATAQQRLDARTVHLEAIGLRLRELDSGWATRATSLGLEGVSLQRMSTWPVQWSHAYTLARSLERACAQRDEYDRKAGPLRHGLREALTLVDASTEPNVPLATWVRRARAAVQQQESLASQRREASRILVEAEDEIVAATTESDRAQEALETWKQRWGAALADAGVTSTLEPQGLLTLLESREALRRMIGQLTALTEARIDPMQAKVRNFGSKVAAVVDACAADLKGREPSEAVHALHERLARARNDATSLGRCKSELQAAENRILDAQGVLDATMEALGPMLHAACVADPDALGAVIASSDQQRRLEGERAQELRTLIDSGDGFDLEALRQEVAQTPMATLAAEITTAELQRETLRSQESEAERQHALDAAAFEALGGADAAACAEALRQSALGDMAEAAEDYVRAKTTERLLDWALQRYREEQQEPLLARASAYFSDLTYGEHVRLIAEPDGTSIRLLSRRSDASEPLVPDTGMSDGTRDQLYLALRLAGLDLHLDGGGIALPFIADDLLINCDDTRAASSFAALARLARKTQVIYFTHHKHLVDLASSVTKGEVNVVTLG